MRFPSARFSPTPPRRGRLLAAAAAGLALIAGTGLEAQQAQQIRFLETDDGEGTPTAIARPTGFNLFAQEDQAFGGMKMTGAMGQYFATDGGPCPYYFNLRGGSNAACMISRNSDGSLTSPFFSMGFIGGAPIHEFRKIRAVWPGVSNMSGDLGYTAPFFIRLVPPLTFRWGPADGQFGFLFSGVTSTDDGSCRDITGEKSGRMDAGVTMTAHSDCPETWPASGWGGVTTLPDSVWENKAAAEGNNFRWDDWTIPASAFDEDILGDQATYGVISDFYREQLQQYGAVTPNGTGAPSIDGYPLGLEVRIDAWQFSRPSIRNALFWKLTMVNKSADVYGQGIDYDSLYYGVDPGFLMNGGPQGAVWYFDFQRNSVIATRGNTSGQCSATYPPTRNPSRGGCVDTRGFSDGVWAMTWLKSPLGDMRNKLFTSGDPETNPYFNPNHPETDDTITFNHAMRRGFGTRYNSTILRGERSRFGVISTTEENVLDGRQITDFALFDFLDIFENERIRELGNEIIPELARFNRFVPGSTTVPTGPTAGQPYGNWDYDDDGVQDTIFVPTCGQFGCATVFADTAAGGYRSFAGNVGNTVTAGPFALAAGDTTQFIWAFHMSPDSISFEATLNNVIGAYLGNYAGASAITPPTFTAADVNVTNSTLRDSIAGLEFAQIRIRVPQPPTGEDAFIRSVYDRMVRDSATPTLRRILSLNPGILDRVLDRARNNFSEMLVFFSCNQGATFSTGTGCTPAQALNPDGSTINSTFGWQPFLRIPVDSASGRLTTTSILHTVPPGRRYLYTFVTRTRGLIDIPVIDSIDGRLASTDLGAALFVDADTINSPLFRSGPSTVDVYAAMSYPAGRRYATLDTATIAGGSTQAINPFIRTAGIDGTFERVYGNRFILTEQIDTVANQTVSSTVQVQRLYDEAIEAGSSTVQTDYVGFSSSYSGDNVVTLTSSGQLLTLSGRNRVSAAGNVVTFVDTLVTDLGYLLARSGGGAPLFLALSATNPGENLFERSAAFPGFFTTNGNTGLVQNITLRGPADTLSTQGGLNTATVRWQTSSDYVADGVGGEYDITWAGDPFGPNAPFRLETPLQLQADMTASINAAPSATTTTTDPEIADELGVDLVAASLPFTVTTKSGAPVTVAMAERSNNTILVGNLGDTARIEIPADRWLPGTPLFFFEDVQVDSTVGGAVVVGDVTVDGRTFKAPLQVTRRVLTAEATIGCQSNTTPARESCNPLALGTLASTGYLPPVSGWTNEVRYVRPFNLNTILRITANPVTFGAQLTQDDMDRIRVVPNPYIVASTFDEVDAGRQATSRVRFTGVPPEGVLRIYSVSGQLIQQIDWTADDLTNIGLGQPNGDLPWNLRSREGLEVGAGLYLYVITAKGSNANGQVARGKFVIIR
jgi:hypothetical protein